MTTLIWDWNGTLLNDLDLCISSINRLLSKRELPLLGRDVYKEVFSFPVKDYYERIGFDFSKEHFEVPAREFIDLYDNQVEKCPLHPAALAMLRYFREKGARQFVLSAMKQSMLKKTLEQKGIYRFFEGIAGLNDHYAVSKIERGRQLIREFHIQRGTTWMIGDTNHDYETARALEVKCILVADGHQSEKRLKETGSRVVSTLDELRGTIPGD